MESYTEKKNKKNIYITFFLFFKLLIVAFLIILSENSGLENYKNNFSLLRFQKIITAVYTYNDITNDLTRRTTLKPKNQINLIN